MPIFRPLITTLLVTASLLMTACSQQPKTGASNIPPKIQSSKDIGYYPLNNKAAIKQFTSDKSIYPGEWLAISGKGLNNTSATVDGNISQVELISPRTMLVKIPTGLDKFSEHTLKVTNDYGHDTLTFKTSHYIIGTDTDSNTHFFMRVGLDDDNKEGLESRAAEIEQDAPLYTMISQDGSLFYSVGLKNRIKNKNKKAFRYIMEIKVINLIATQKPSEIANHTITLDSTPTDAKLGPNGQLVLLGKYEMVLASFTNQSLKLEETLRYQLPINDPKTSTYTDIEYLDNGNKVVVLNSGDNKAVILDLGTAPTPTIKHTLDIFPDANRPSVTDIVVDQRQGDTFWVLGGQNLRNFSRKTIDLIGNLFKKDKTTQPVNDAAFSQVLSYQLTPDSITKGEKIELPKNQVPFFGHIDKAGRLNVSAMDWEFYEFTNKDKAWYKNIPQLLAGAITIGKIYKIDLNSKEVNIGAKGTGIYFHIDSTPKLGAIFSTVKIGPKLLPPFMTLKWGITIESKGTFHYRKMSRDALIPPYSMGRIAIQH